METTVPTFKADDGNFVQFFWREKKNPQQSIAEGRPIYDKALYVRVIAPGLKDQPEFEMNEDRRQRYAGPLRAFLEQDASADVQGTPLSQWPGCDVAQAAELREQHILTVEMLAEIPDSAIHRFGPGTRDLRAKALAWLDAAKGNAPIEKLAAENAALRNQVDALTKQLADLAAKVEEKDKRRKKEAA